MSSGTVISTESPLDLADLDGTDVFVTEYENAVVYADRENDTVLHEGAVRILANRMDRASDRTPALAPGRPPRRHVL